MILGILEDMPTYITIYGIDLKNLTFKVKDCNNKEFKVSLLGPKAEDFPEIILESDGISKQYAVGYTPSTDTLFLELSRYSITSDNGRVDRDLSQFLCRMTLTKDNSYAYISVEKTHMVPTIANYILPNEDVLMEKLMVLSPLATTVEELFKLVQETLGLYMSEYSITTSIGEFPEGKDSWKKNELQSLRVVNGNIKDYSRSVVLPSGKQFLFGIDENGEIIATSIEKTTLEAVESSNLEDEQTKIMSADIEAVKKIGRFKPKKD
jgi:hypothetical protein